MLRLAGCVIVQLAGAKTLMPMDPGTVPLCTGVAVLHVTVRPTVSV